MTWDPLRQRAVELGVEISYWDVEGQLHHASDRTLTTVVEVLETDAAGDVGRGHEPTYVGRGGDWLAIPVRAARLELVDGGEVAAVITDGHVVLPSDIPIGCHRLVGEGHDGTEVVTTIVVPPWTMPRDPRLDGRTSALFVPAYALWTEERPLPSFRLLRELAALVAPTGIDLVSTLPLYAAFLDDPFDPSPYAPISRMHWNEVYVDDEVLEPAPLPDTSARLTDWRALAVRRRAQLLATAGRLDGDTIAALTRFTTERPDVTAFARFQTARRVPADAGHPEALVQRSYELAQYLAHRQLGDTADDAALLALDLPIGSHPMGYETWAYPDLFATGMSVGAPPDEIFRGGQNWGFRAPLPRAGRRSGHELWRRVVAHAGEHTSMLRVDHVMGVQRLWWIPDGAGATDGAYVRYHREELLAVIAAEAWRSGTTIVGEDLGTVSDEVRDAMRRWDLIGLYEEQFHLHAWDLPRPPQRSVAGLRTHDMPAFAAVVADEGLPALEGYRQRLEGELRRAIPAEADGLLDGALERLARSDADVVVADLDDLIGETAPHNVPGSISDDTWRRRLPGPMTEILGRDDVTRRLHLIAERGNHD